MKKECSPEDLVRNFDAARLVGVDDEIIDCLLHFIKSNVVSLLGLRKFNLA